MRQINYLFDNAPFVIWDTEYTSWEGCIENGWDESEGQYKELVQIGAVKVNTNGEIIGTFDNFVKPRFNPDLSDYFKHLTEIEQESVNNAADISEVWRSYSDWIENFPCFSYGSDIDVVAYNSALYEIELDFTPHQFHNIRPLFRACGLPVDDYHSGELYKSVDVSIKEDLTAHNALNDCISLLETAKYLSEV